MNDNFYHNYDGLNSEENTQIIQKEFLIFHNVQNTIAKWH